MTSMRLKYRRITCDVCNRRECLVVPRLRQKHSSYELPPGWVVNKTPGKGVQILCGEGCSRGQPSAALTVTVSPTA